MASDIRVLVFGAHPDDDDLQCGGTAIKLSKAGHMVKFVSCTNGGTGHHAIGGIELVRRGYEEAQRVAKVAGIAECSTPFQLAKKNRNDDLENIFWTPETGIA